MNHVRSFFLAVIFVLGTMGTGHAIIFEDVQDLNVWLAEGPVAARFHNKTYTYTHNMPADFEIPWDNLLKAELTITGYYIDGPDDQVVVEDASMGFLNPGGTRTLSCKWVDRRFKCEWVYDLSVTTFDISSLFDSWTAGDPLQVTVQADGGIGDFRLRLRQSFLKLEYENGGPSASSVPEPAAWLLIGTGALGLMRHLPRFRS